MKKLFSFLAVVALMIGGARAEEMKPFTLQQAQAAAIQHHPRISEAELIALAAKQVVREAQSAYFPVATANATAVDSTASNTRIAAGGLNNPLILTREADGVNVSQLITDFGRSINLTASSKLQARAQEQNALATRAEILLAVNTAYFEALQAQSILTVAKQTVSTRQLTYDQVSELASNKLKSGLDVSFAKVDLASSKLLLANAGNDLQASFATLSNVLGERVQQNYLLVDQPVTTNTVPADSELVQTALRNRPDIIQLRLQKDAAGRFARAEKDLQYPTVSAIGSAGVVPLHDESLRANYAAAGVNVSVPIFDGMLFSAREREAELRERASEEVLRDAEDNVIRDVRIAGLNLNYAAQRLTLTEELLESANESFELAQARYKVGSSSIVELSQAQLNQTEAEIAQARAKYEYQTRTSILNFQLGQNP
ncbi:MAG TPA: TolC family protein [Verrucomicrobiae bacterium]|nr:TolC family protein [Verrucomicrobiae bacterium]